MATGNRQATDTAPQIDTKPEESPEVQNPAPEPQDTGLQRSSTGEYRVLVGALNLSEDKDGKQVRRYARGAKIKPAEHVDVERLLALRAIEPFGTRADSVGPSTAAHLARAANAAAQETEPEFLDDGAPTEVTGE